VKQPVVFCGLFGGGLNNAGNRKFPSNPLPRIWSIVVRGRCWILLTGTVVTMATVAVLYQIPNRDKSEATLFVVHSRPRLATSPATETNIADALQAMTQNVLSRARLLDLIDEFGLYAKERQRLARKKSSISWTISKR
jgi:hypothetical protein